MLRLLVVVLVVVFGSESSLWGKEPANKCEGVLGDAVINSENVVSYPYTLPFDAVSFHTLKSQHIREAIAINLEVAKANLQRLIDSPEKPTFANTVLALEDYDGDLNDVLHVFFILNAVKLNDDLKQIYKDFFPQITKLGHLSLTDSKLFKRIESLYLQRNKLDLSPEQLRLLEEYYDSRVRNGALLDAAKKARLLEIDERLSLLAKDYQNHVTDHTSAMSFEVENASDLRGLPRDFTQSIYDQAKKKWVINFTQAHRQKVLEKCEDRELRQRYWRKYQMIAREGEYSNLGIMVEIAQLRAEKSQILGFKNFAELALQTRMLNTPESVQTFLDELAPKYKEKAAREMKELEEFAGHELEPWDISFYRERLRAKLYNYDVEQLRPYLVYQNVLAAALNTAERLFKIKFTFRTDIPGWDKSIRTYEVEDELGQHLGLIYFDPFARPGEKVAGAFNTSVRPGGLRNGAMRRPHVVNVQNIMPPADGQPALLSNMLDVTTLFHELGHAVHVLRSKALHASHFGTRVARDAVEVPSQLLEKWATIPEIVAQYARHYETNEVIPMELLEKVRAAEKFHSGLIGLRQIYLAKLDMAWHTGPDYTQIDPLQFDRDVLASYSVKPVHPEDGLTEKFSHVFAGSYAAGYYSYKWSEVMVEDAWEFFNERGDPFHPLAPALFRAQVLERGGAEDFNVLYRLFRGSDPDITALLRAEGLISD